MKQRTRLASHSATENTDRNSKNQGFVLAAASARRLSIHLNAWPPPILIQELDRTWRIAVSTEADNNPQFRYFYEAWKTVVRQIEQCRLSEMANEKVDADLAEEVMRRVRNCMERAGVRDKVEKTGWWEQRGDETLEEDLRHLNFKLAPVCDPEQLTARYIFGLRKLILIRRRLPAWVKFVGQVGGLRMTCCKSWYLGDWFTHRADV